MQEEQPLVLTWMGVVVEVVRSCQALGDERRERGKEGTRVNGQ